jgi:hypothetical protein
MSELYSSKSSSYELHLNPAVVDRSKRLQNFDLDAPSTSHPQEAFFPYWHSRKECIRRTNRIVFQHAQRSMRARSDEGLVVSRQSHGDEAHSNCPGLGCWKLSVFASEVL